MAVCDCTPVDNFFNPRKARRELKSFRKRGVPRRTREMLAAIEKASLPSGPTLLDIGGGVGACPPNSKPYVTVYIQVADVQASLDKAAKLGGRVVLPPTPIPGVGTNALFTDPEGNMVGLFKPNA